MTVKLAKLFGSNSSSGSSNNSNNNETQPPPLPPPNANMKHKYYDHQPSAIYGNAYDDGEDDYDEDNMSLYSAAGLQRSHPYNNSQRPLLGERKPQVLASSLPASQLLAKKKLLPLPPPPPPPLHLQQMNIHVNAHAHAHGGAGIGPGVAYVSPYVQQQKRDSAKGLHGFNDFDALSQQYNQHLQSPHIGYPYGSPPSPTAQSSDFVFEPLHQQQQHLHHYQQQHQQQQQHHHGKPVSTSSTATSKSNCSSTSTSPAAGIAVATSTPRYGNVVGYQYGGSREREQQCDVYYAAQQQQHLPPAPPPLPHYQSHPSRFEDDFCTRRNMDFVAAQTQAQALAQPPANSGPFIFGVSHEQQTTDYGRGLAHTNSHHQLNLNQTPHTVINATAPVPALATSPSPVKEHNALQQSLSDTSADSGKGAKFLLRKRKSKKTTTTAAATNTTAASEHKAKQQKLPATPPRPQPTVKCVLVGDAAVGKTNLILSYRENRFNPEHVPTASDIYNADVMVDDSPVHLTLCDTAGQDTLDPLRELCYPDSDVFLLCFSVVNPETFRAIKSKWAPKFAKSKAALLLVGTQSDLRSNFNVLNKLQTNGEKPISYADAWDLATTIGAKYIETSSATQDKVKDVFDTAIWEGLVPTTLPPTPSFWKKLFCLA